MTKIVPSGDSIVIIKDLNKSFLKSKTNLVETSAIKKFPMK